MTEFLLLLLAFVKLCSCVDRTYYAVNSVQTWVNAGTYCMGVYGGHLAIILDDEDIAAANVARTAAGIYAWGTWIGMYDSTDDNLGWKWADEVTNCDYVDSGNCYDDDHWGTNDPDYSGGCALLFGSSEYFTDIACGGTNVFLCSTGSPTSAPTTQPPTTASPTLSCEDDGSLTHFDWDTMSNDESEQPQYTDLEMSVDDSDLSLTISVTVPYLGSAYGNHEDEANFGVTYVLDFEDFNAHTNNIYEPGTCQNRDDTGFYDDNGDLKDITEWWDYSDIPYQTGHVGSEDYMAYPPSDVWAITANGCDTVTYSVQLTWAELEGCYGYNGGDSYVSVTSGDNWLNLSGTFYINVVSPFWYSSPDLGYYRVFQILSQPFVIAVSTSVYVLDSTGINLFTMSVVAVYKENAEQYYKLIVLTESAEYLLLGRDSDDELLAYSSAGASTYVTSSFIAYDDAVTGTGDDACLDNKDYICSQLWEIRIENVVCDETSGEGTDFSGEYSMQFTPDCRGTDYDYDHCVDWLASHATIASGVTLSTDLTWVDETCDPEVFQVQFEAEYNFYSDEFTNEIGTDTSEEEYLFAVGVDTIYAEIVTKFPTETYEVFETELLNVWICTFAPDTEVGDADNVPEDTDTGIGGGCFSADKDDDVDYTSHIYGGTTVYYDFNSGYTAPDTASVRFSFTVPNQVHRDTLYIHAQIQVALYSEDGRRRRLLMSEFSEPITNRMKHFNDFTGIDHGQDPDYVKPIAKPVGVVDKPIGVSPLFDLSNPVVMAFIAIVAMVVFVNVMFICYSKCGKVGKGRYEFVKQDSEMSAVESEANQLIL